MEYWHRASIALIGVLMAVTPALVQSATTPPICEAAGLSRCGQAPDINTEACWQLLHACGSYRQLLDHFGTELSTIAADPEAWYYRGLAHHGLHIRNRSKAAICAHRQSAREALGYFLTLTQDTTLINKEATFEKTYHAAQLFEELRATEGCPEVPPTDFEIQNYAVDYGRKLIEGLYLGDTPPGALGKAVSDTRASMQTAIRNYATDAVAAETQLELRKAAVTESERVANKIETKLKSSFKAQGTSQTQLTPPTNGIFTPEKALYNKLTPVGTNTNTVTQFHADLETALGNMSIVDYEKARDQVVPEARNLFNAGETLRLSAEPVSAISVSAVEQAGQTVLSRTVNSQPLQNIVQEWRTAFPCPTNPNAPQPWFCRGQ